MTRSNLGFSVSRSPVAMTKTFHLLFNSIFRATPEVVANCTLLKYVKSQRNCFFFNHKRAYFLASKSWIFVSFFSLLN